MSTPLFPGSLLLELGQVRHLGLSQLCWPTFLPQGEPCAGRHSTVAHVGRGVGFLHKICLVQTCHFSGCSLFHQGCNAELIWEASRHLLYLETATCLGTSNSSKKHASAKILPCAFSSSGIQPALPSLNLPVATKENNTWGHSDPGVSPGMLWPQQSSAQELTDILDSCKVDLSHMGEEYPNLYTGNMQVLFKAELFWRAREYSTC